MTASRPIICFINIGHAIDHMFMRAYRELIALSLGGFIAFGAGSVPPNGSVTGGAAAI
jgi:hypothetical protein